MKKTTPSTYKKDKYYSSVKNSILLLLQQSKVITPADVFIQIGNLTKANYEQWRFGKVPYLERVIDCNLSAINRKLRILKHTAIALGLKPSRTVYKKWGKGQKHLLRFSKTGNDTLEELYSTHYIRREQKPDE